MKYVTFRGLRIPKITQPDLDNRIRVFNVAFNEQYPEIERKLKIAKGENKKQIEDYRKDVLQMKKEVDRLTKLQKRKGIKGKLAKSKFAFIDSKKLLYLSLKLMRKWKNYSGDITNFPV